MSRPVNRGYCERLNVTLDFGVDFRVGIAWCIFIITWLITPARIIYLSISNFHIYFSNLFSTSTFSHKYTCWITSITGTENNPSLRESYIISDQTSFIFPTATQKEKILRNCKDSIKRSLQTRSTYISVMQSLTVPVTNELPLFRGEDRIAPLSVLLWLSSESESWKTSIPEMKLIPTTFPCFSIASRLHLSPPPPPPSDDGFRRRRKASTTASSFGNGS